MSRPASPAVIFAAACVLLGLAGMLFVAFKADLSLVKETRSRGNIGAMSGASAPEKPSGPSEADLPADKEQVDELMEQMAKLRESPNDADALRKTGEIFVAAKDWKRAEVFLGRAVLSRPGDTRPRYLLGVCFYQQNKFDEAAKTFEELLVIREDPSAMYNLAVIYKYHMGQKSRGRDLAAQDHRLSRGRRRHCGQGQGGVIEMMGWPRPTKSGMHR